MKWTDINDIAISLSEKHPDKDPAYIRFTDLMTLVLALPDFEGKLDHCNEKILEAIQAAWIDEQS